MQSSILTPRQAAEVGLCPIGRAAAVLGDYWTLVIVREALFGVTRYEALRAHLQIADNILSNRLGQLVDAGLLVRIPYRDARRTRHEYRLTEAGAATEPLIRALAAWGQERRPSPGDTRRFAIVHSPCGATVPPGPVCANCGGVLEREDERWLVPWLQAEPLVPAGPPTGCRPGAG